MVNHWKILHINVPNLITENPRLKHLHEYTKDNSIILINITETWLNKTVGEEAVLE